jgi:hypothetical protein
LEICGTGGRTAGRNTEGILRLRENFGIGLQLIFRKTVNFGGTSAAAPDPKRVVIVDGRFPQTGKTSLMAHAVSGDRSLNRHG